MVFESVFSAVEVRSHPWKMSVLGLLYSSAGILLSLWVFPSNPSISSVFFTTIAVVPLLVKVLKIEETEDFKVKRYPLIGNHKDVLGIIFFLFIGLMISFTVWFSLLPEEVNNKVFSSQISTITNINNTLIQGGFLRSDFLRIILLNNFKVLLFCLLFSLIYGAGAAFIVTWNASVLGTAIGYSIKSSTSSYLLAIPQGFGQYLLHGIPEVIAYFLAGIAGGIISAAVLRHDIKSNKFKEVILDSIDLIILASVILIISGFIEVYISLGV